MKSKSQNATNEDTGQKSMGKSQQQNGENHYAVFDRMLEGVQLLDHDWYYLYLNAAAEKHNRRPNQELLGNKYMDMWPGIEETHVFSEIKHCMEDRVPSELENRFVYPDETVGWFKLSIQPVPEGVLIMSFDITEQVQAKTALRRSEEYYRRLAENFPNGTVNIYDRDLRMTFVAGSDLKKYDMGPEAFIGKTFKELSPAATFSIAEPHLHAAFEGKPGSYETSYWDDRYYLVNVAPLVNADGSINEILVVTQNLTERKRMEDNLRKTQEQLMLAIRSANVGLWDWDLKTNEVYYSSEWKSQLGYEDHEVSNDLSEWESRVHPEDLESARKTVSTYLEKPCPNYFNEYRMRHKDGSYRWILAQGALVIDERGKPIRMIGSHIDVTRRKQADEALRESEERFRLFIEHAPASLAMFDREMRYLAVSRRWRTDYNLGDKKILGRSHYEIFPEIPEQWKKIHQRGLSGEVIKAEHDKFVRLDGSVQWQCWEVRPWHYASGKIGGIVIFTEDITDQVLATDALHESETRYRTLVEQIPAVTYIASLDEASTSLYVSPQIGQYLGVDADEYRTNPDIWRQLLHPADRARVLEEVQQSHESGESFAAEYRMLSRDGQIVWIRDEAAIVRDSSGEPKFLQGLMFDITERKQMEMTLAENEQRFRGLIDHAPDGIVIYGASGRIEYASPSTERIMGYAPEEILATDPAQVTHPDDLPALEEALVELMQTPTKTITKQYRMRHKDGSWLWLESNISNFSDVPGINGLVFNFRDISERKSAEREIQQHTEDLLLIMSLNDAANRSEDIESIIDAFAHEVRKVFDCLAVSIYLLSPDGKHLEMQSYTIPRDMINKIETLIGQPIPRVRVPIKAGSILNQTLENEGGMLLDNPRTIRQWIEEFSETTFLPLAFRPVVKKLIPQIHKILNIGSAISIPLIASGRAIGIMDMSSKGQFTEDDLQRIRNIRSQVTAVLLRKQIEKQVKFQLQRMQALSNIDRAISSSLDIRISLDVLLREVLSQLKVDAAAVLLLNQSTQMLEFVAGKGFRSPSIRQSRVRLGEGLAGKVGIERELLHVPNLPEVGDEFTRAELFTIEEFVEYLAVPLIAKGVLKGVLEIYHRTFLDLDPEWKSYLETLSGQAAIAIDNTQLFEGMQKSNQELIMAYDATITGWSRAMDLRDEETEDHTQRVTELTLKLAEKFGISRQEQVQIRRGALLHDIGKLGVPDSILLKPGKLTEDEWEIMRQHPIFAYEMLMPIAYLRPALDIPYCHHEKWDGSGYPRGLKGEQIPLAARIFAVIDVWDALTSDRPYRSAWTHENALEYIKEQSGRYFDPDVVEVFLETISKEIK